MIHFAFPIASRKLGTPVGLPFPLLQIPSGRTVGRRGAAQVVRQRFNSEAAPRHTFLKIIS